MPTVDQLVPWPYLPLAVRPPTGAALPVAIRTPSPSFVPARVPVVQVYPSWGGGVQYHPAVLMGSRRSVPLAPPGRLKSARPFRPF